MRKYSGKRHIARTTPAAALPIPRQQRSAVTGQFLAVTQGEVGAHQSHGLKARRVPPEYLTLQREFLAAALVDEGERPEDVPRRRRALLEYRAVLHRQVAQLDATFQAEGLFDRRGRLRVAWLSQLTGLIGRAESVDRLLGLARRQRSVSVVDDPAEYLANQGPDCRLTQHAHSQEVTCERR